MSSTFVHYSTPSSLPSDYAVLSRYAATHPENAVEDSVEEAVATDAESLSEGTSDHTRYLDIHPDSRRRSFPTSYITPFNPTSKGPLPDHSGHHSGPKEPNATENTPLLAPLVPRIIEEIDETDGREPSTSANLYREELAILAKYTLPVFGYVTNFQSFNVHITPSVRLASS